MDAPTTLTGRERCVSRGSSWGWRTLSSRASLTRVKLPQATYIEAPVNLPDNDGGWLKLRCRCCPSGRNLRAAEDQRLDRPGGRQRLRECLQRHRHHHQDLRILSLCRQALARQYQRRQRRPRLRARTAVSGRPLHPEASGHARHYGARRHVLGRRCACAIMKKNGLLDVREIGKLTSAEPMKPLNFFDASTLSSLC